MNDDIKSIRPCICCHNACFNMAHYKGVGNDQSIHDNAGMARCAINPVTMHTKKYKIIPAKKQKNVAVIGGGIGGMETARVLALRGHKVTLFEKSDQLGGVFIAAAAPSFKEKDRELIDWYKKEMTDLGIDIKLGAEVKDIKSLGFDDVVVATGSAPRKLNVKGAEKAVEACEYLLGTKPVGDNVIVIGGGLTGCEIALDLFNKGKKVTIVEMKNDLIAVKGVCLANSSYLRDMFELHSDKVDVKLETALKEITDNGVVVTDKEGKEYSITGDSVILSVGYIPNPLDPKAKLVGDCKTVGNLRTVVWRAWDVAMKI